MTRMLLTIGPQGAGKSTFCESVMGLGIEGVAYASRDQFLESLYGRAAWDPYAGVAETGMRRFYHHVAELAVTNRVVLVECWAPGRGLLTDVKSKVGLAWRFPDYRSLEWEALWFITPDEQCAEWYVEREHKPTCTESSKKFSYHHKYADSRRFRAATDDCIERCFDTVWTIDPRQLTLLPYSDILGLHHDAQPI